MIGTLANFLSVDEEDALVICNVLICGAIDPEPFDEPESLLSKNFCGALASIDDDLPKSLRHDDRLSPPGSSPRRH